MKTGAEYIIEFTGNDENINNQKIEQSIIKQVQIDTINEVCNRMIVVMGIQHQFAIDVNRVNFISKLNK